MAIGKTGTTSLVSASKTFYCGQGFVRVGKRKLNRFIFLMSLNSRTGLNDNICINNKMLKPWTRSGFLILFCCIHVL